MICLLQLDIIQELTSLSESDRRYVIAKQHAICRSRLELLSLEDIRHMCRQIVEEYSTSMVRQLLPNTSYSCSNSLQCSFEALALDVQVHKSFDRKAAGRCAPLSCDPSCSSAHQDTSHKHQAST
jgi:hypothetical protein